MILSQFYIRSQHRWKEVRHKLGYRPAPLLFEHIPKSGGTSVKHFLESQYPNSRMYLIDGMNVQESIDKFFTLPEKERYRFELILGHGAHKLRKDCNPKLKKATVFRDPIARIISHYYFVKESSDHFLHKQVKKGMTLEEYVSTDLSPELTNNYIRRFPGLHSDQAQQNAEESITTCFKIITEEYDYIGLLDQVDEFMNELAQGVGFKDRFQPARRNVTKNKPKEIDDASMAAIIAKNHLDIELYKRLQTHLKTD